MSTSINFHGCRKLEVTQFLPESANAIAIKFHGRGGYGTDLEVNVFGLPDSTAIALNDFLETLGEIRKDGGMNGAYREDGAEFYGDSSSISGVAVYDYTVEECFDADHGGRDGLEVTHCELLRVELNGLHLTREQIVSMTDSATVAAVEEATRGAMQETLDAGETI